MVLFRTLWSVLSLVQFTAMASATGRGCQSPDITELYHLRHISSSTFHPTTDNHFGWLFTAGRKQAQLDYVLNLLKLLSTYVKTFVLNCPAGVEQMLRNAPEKPETNLFRGRFTAWLPVALLYGTGGGILRILGDLRYRPVTGSGRSEYAGGGSRAIRRAAAIAYSSHVRQRRVINVP